MQRKALLALAAVAVVGVVCLALVVLPGSRPITVRLAKALQSHDDATLTFEIKNNTAGVYRLGSFAVLEVRNDAVWEEFYYCTVRQLTLAGHASMTFTSAVPILPKPSALRLQLDVHKRQDGFWAFLTRMRMGAGLNPFTRIQMFAPGTEVLSDQFTLPSVTASTEPRPSAESDGLK